MRTVPAHIWKKLKYYQQLPRPINNIFTRDEQNGSSSLVKFLTLGELIFADVFDQPLGVCIFRFADQLHRYVFIDNGFAAIGADMRGDIPHEQAKLVALEGDGCEAVDQLSLSANDAIHKNFLTTKGTKEHKGKPFLSSASAVFLPFIGIGDVDCDHCDRLCF